MASKSQKIADCADEAWRRWAETADEEQIALSRHSQFREMLRRSSEDAKRHGGHSIDEVPAFRDLTPKKEAEGERLLAELERQTEEEEAARLAVRGRHGRANGTTRRTGRDTSAGPRKASKATT